MHQHPPSWCALNLLHRGLKLGHREVGRRKSSVGKLTPRSISILSAKQHPDKVINNKSVENKAMGTIYPNSGIYIAIKHALSSINCPFSMAELVPEYSKTKREGLYLEVASNGIKSQLLIQSFRSKQLEKRSWSHENKTSWSGTLTNIRKKYWTKRI